MSVVVLEFGALTVMAKYIFQKSGGGPWYFRRRLPDDILKHYPAKKNGYLIFSLQTKDAAKAAQLAHRQALEQDALWAKLRDGSVAEGPDLVRAANALLSSFGLKAGQYVEYDKAGLEPDKFLDDLRYQADAREPESNTASWADDLPPLHRLAADLFYGKKQPVFLSSAIKEFQELKGEDPASRAGALRRRVVSEFIAEFGDLSIDHYTRENANDFVKFLAKKGNKTATIKRRLNSIRPVFRQMSRERELDDRRIFEAINIPNEGDDKVDRLPFSKDEISLIQRACLEKDDEMRWVVGLLSDTGLRLAEAIGLREEDIHLAAPDPYISIRPNEARRLKTKGSERKVPLVGVSLWAVKRAVAHASDGYVFPRYIDFGKKPLANKSTHASNSLSKWLRTLRIADSDRKSTHSFRHSLQDRLKEVQTPQELRNAIGGWTNKGIGEGYGTGYTVAVLSEHMKKIVVVDTAETTTHGR
ncbi:DUF6538 domain-containing protein [uncultured Sulfitobacter sp.]|uniref:DUF6538 domain-containing protein n=1 Tax=Sulfitobacter sp. SH22 TaxID=3421172 RepID=UPI0025CE9374|nr:DUF6538 domain-containing protein [uncultured Sulfitobacter sp.]